MNNKDKLIEAFIQGAAWWEYEKNRFTMWQSDKKKARKVAEKRFKERTLGLKKIFDLDDWIQSIKRKQVK
jgi:hypothetical protein